MVVNGVKFTEASSRVHTTLLLRVRMTIRELVNLELLRIKLSLVH